ncbi:MAG TPA: hypothetical protein VFC13_26470 [Actinomycetes bacterium]|nr:hypothetical protein [Actinomycetes bacterium]
MREVARAAVRLAGGLALLAGAPAGLIVAAGWPLPRSIPTLAQIGDAFDRQGVPLEIAVKTLAIVVWVAWAQLAWAVAVEAIAAIRGRPSRHAPVLPGLHTLACQLVAAATLIVTLLGPLRPTGTRPAVAGPLVALEATPNLSPTATQPAAARTAGPAPGQHVVQHGDSY